MQKYEDKHIRFSYPDELLLDESVPGSRYVLIDQNGGAASITMMDDISAEVNVMQMKNTPAPLHGELIHSGYKHFGGNGVLWVEIKSDPDEDGSRWHEVQAIVQVSSQAIHVKVTCLQGDSSSICEGLVKSLLTEGT